MCVCVFWGGKGAGGRGGLFAADNYLATLRRFLRLIFPELSSSNNLKAFNISSCGSLSNIISVTETNIVKQHNHH